MPSQVEHKVRWEVDKPFTVHDLLEIREVCDQAIVPEHATLKIIHWAGDSGYTVEAKWS